MGFCLINQKDIKDKIINTGRIPERMMSGGTSYGEERLFGEFFLEMVMIREIRHKNEMAECCP